MVVKIHAAMTGCFRIPATRKEISAHGKEISAAGVFEQLCLQGFSVRVLKGVHCLSANQFPVGVKQIVPLTTAF